MTHTQTSPMATLSLIIRALNEESHIGRLLTGVMKQTVRPDEIVLVDSGSTDATVAIASAFPAVKVITIDPEEFSFGRALNKGCAAAEGELLVLASAHVYPLYDTWLERLVAPFVDPEVALSYGRQCGSPDSEFSEKRLLQQWFPERVVRRQRDPFCNNANAAIRRSVWEQLKYNEDLTGLEDVDWAKRSLERGFVVSYAADAIVAHVHEESFGQIINRYRREAIAHKEIYNDQAMTLGKAAHLTVANVAADLREAVREGVPLRSALVGIPRFRIAQFYGAYRGFTQQGPVSDLLRRRFYYPSPPSTPSEGAGSVGTRIEYEEPIIR